MAANGKFIAYYRVSTKAQGTSGLGLDAQREAVARYLNGGTWTLLAEYQDIESGTRKGNARPELAKAVAHAKRERATLIIAKLDRLARNVHFITGLMESGVDFVAADMPQADNFMFHVMAAVAEREAVAISTRTKEALAAAKARGTKLGTPKNLTTGAKVRGTSATESKFDEYYLRLAERILAARANNVSFAAIAAQLNSEGEVTREGSAFKPMTVKRIFDRFNKEDRPMTTTRTRRNPLIEAIPQALLDLLDATRPMVGVLMTMVENEGLPAPVREAARHYVDRYDALTADPERWMPRYIDDSIDRIAALSYFEAESPDVLFALNDEVPMVRRLRRQGLWAWMHNDLAHLLAGRQVHEPFTCLVPRQFIGQRAAFKASAQDAAEFYLLSRFLPAYHAATGVTLSFVRKGLPMDKSGRREPDFIVADTRTGEEIGLEMTDAVGKVRACQSRFFWQLAAELDERLGDFEGSVEIHDRQYEEANDIRWDTIAYKYREPFLAQVLARVTAASKGRFQVDLADEAGLKGIIVSFGRKRGRRFIMHSDQYGWSGDVPEQIAARNLNEALANKVDEPEPYSTKRTFLVVYPLREMVMGEYEAVLEHAEPVLKDLMARNSRFQEVWICEDKILHALHARHEASAGGSRRSK